MGDFIVSIVIWFGLLGLGLALLSAKWPRYWKPVLGAYLEVVKVGMVLAFNCLYYSLLAALRVVQIIGGAIQRRKGSA